MALIILATVSKPFLEDEEEEVITVGKYGQVLRGFVEQLAIPSTT